MDIPSRFSNHTRTIVILLLTLTSGLVLTSGLLTSASAAKTNGTSTFTTYELGGNPFVVGNSVGTVCPNTVGTCTNTEGEPAIRADLAATSTAQARTSSASSTDSAEGPSPGDQLTTGTTSQPSHCPTASQPAATVSHQLAATQT